MESSQKSPIPDLGGLSIEDSQATKHFDAYQDLLSEVDSFSKIAGSKVDIRHYRTHMLNDLKGVQRIIKTQPPEKHSHVISSSNLTFFQAVWDAAKRSKAVKSILKRGGQPADLVVDGGLRWIKVATMTEKRMLYDMARQGWIWDDDDEDLEERQNEDEDEMMEGMDDFQQEIENGSEDEDDEASKGLSLVKIAMKLLKASEKERVRYKHPKVTLILPRISYGSVSHIDTVLDKVRKLGVEVICADDDVLQTPAPPLDEATITRMIPDEIAGFSSTLNIDCTILLALVSDISHKERIEELPWFNRAVKRQLEMEEEKRLLPETLYPAIVGRSLVCTEEAATRMREITAGIGTETEVERMKLLLNETGVSGTELRSRFASLSCHAVPDNLLLPVKILPRVNIDEAIAAGKLPANARKIGEELSDINNSVLLFGWVHGFTTITSNRGAASTIKAAIENNRTSEADTGPDVWLSWTSRSLIAKEKDRKGTGF